MLRFDRVVFCFVFPALSSVCFECFKELTGIDESATVDCKSGPLAGCGLRFCSLKCLVACSKRGHADMCQEVQRLLEMFKAKHFRPDAETYKAAAELGNAKRDGGRNQAQICMLAADLFIAEDEKGKALQVTSDALLELGALRFALVSAEAALELAEEGTAEAANCYLKIGTILSKLGKHDAALLNLNKALPICQTLQVRAVVNCYINMANVLFAQGKHMAAMEKYMDVLRMFESKEREDVAMCVKIVLCDLDNREVADVATCVNNMGAVLRALGDYDGAMKMYEVVQQIHRCLHKGEEHADVADCYNNMGNVLQEQGEYEAAMERIDSALEIRKKLQGKEHADVAMCYINMGIVLHALDEHQKAMKKFEAALQIYKKVSGADSANYSSALLTLATGACVTKSSLDDTYLAAELRRIMDVDAELFNSISPSVFAFGLRNHIVLLRLTARFGQRTGETMEVERWRTNVQRLIDVAHPLAHALGLQELVGVSADSRFASATACESEQLLAALRASASPCALREATGAREQLLSSLFIDEAGARKAQMRAVAAHSHSLSLLGLDGLERIDDDLVAQLMRARVLEQEVLQRCAGELSNVKARDTSAEVRNGVADVFVLLLNVLDQAFARLAVASGAKPGNLYFPCKGSTDALRNSIADALPLVIKHALDAEVRGGRVFVVDDDKQYVRRNVAVGTDLYKIIEPSQAFVFFKDKSRVFGESEWLHLTTLIANENKHIKLSQHVHSATLKDKSRGTIEQRDVTLNVSASGPSPDLKNWTLYHWPALAEEVHDDIERRAVSRLARKFLTGIERGDDGNTVPVGGVTENKYLQHYHVGAYDLFFVPPPIADVDKEMLRRELVKDLARFDLVRKYSGKIDWLLARDDSFLSTLCTRELEKAVGRDVSQEKLPFPSEVLVNAVGRSTPCAKHMTWT
jgi:tetratricopeptide (TPR) repeat protein